jgi:hypothetical protein
MRAVSELPAAAALTTTPTTTLTTTLTTTINPSPLPPPLATPQVCNHPDLFEGRSIVSSFDMEPIVLRVPSLVACAGSRRWDQGHDLLQLGLVPAALEAHGSAWEARECAALRPALEQMLLVAAAAGAPQRCG